MNVQRDELSDETPIWRYMDLPRFVAILSSQTLWFAKAARFEDGYDGFCRVQFPKELENDSSPKVITRTKEGQTTLVSLPRMMLDITGLSAEYFHSARDHLYVNSWCMAHESMAMWQIYGAAGGGLALKSTVGRYKRAAKFNVRAEQYTFGAVKYDADLTSSGDLNLDLRHGAIPVPGPGVWEKLLKVAFYKRTCFEYEREWRAALYQDNPPDWAGCGIEFDLKELISAVYVGPRADAFFQDVVNAIMYKFGFEKPLERSTLLQPPQPGVATVSGTNVGRS